MTVIDDEFDLDLRLLRTRCGAPAADLALLAEFDLDVQLGELTGVDLRIPVDAATEPIGVPTAGRPGQTCDTRNDSCGTTCAGHHTCPFTECGSCPDDTCPTCPSVLPAFPC